MALPSRSRPAPVAATCRAMAKPIPMFLRAVRPVAGLNDVQGPAAERPVLADEAQRDLRVRGHDTRHLLPVSAVLLRG
jgi:hypothetical protein